MKVNGAAPARWAWADLRETGPEAESRAEEIERQERDVEQAYRRGYAEGEAAGVTAARDELRVAMGATVAALEDVRANRDAWEARLQERLVVLAAAMAQKVVGRVCDEDPRVFVDTAKQAVTAFPLSEPVRIRLHPSDEALLVDGGYVSEVVGERTVRWIPDEDVVPGGCIVEGPDRIVDARVDEALARVVRALTDG